MSLTFITGNQHKADNLARLIGMPVDHMMIDLDEIQSINLEEIVEHKVRQAYEIAKRPVLVDDVALSFAALHGLPGPFVKFFVQAEQGHETLCRMLDGFENRAAQGISTQGYFDGTNLKLFTGIIQGTIADHPRGQSGYGWDVIFCPEGYGGRTRAELTAKEYDEVYRQIRPFEALKAYLGSIA